MIVRLSLPSQKSFSTGIFLRLFFFSLPRSGLYSFSVADRVGGWLGRGSSPRDWDQRKNYQGSERGGPGFGPVGDLPHVNKDRASVARSCPA